MNVEVCISLAITPVVPIAYRCFYSLCIHTFLVDENNSIQAAIARTAARSMALYFSRPVRLFRPAKGDQPAKLEELMLILNFVSQSMVGIR